MKLRKTILAAGVALLTMAVFLDAAIHKARASNAAWIFAHRANSLETVGFASSDQGVNAIEVDVSFRLNIKEQDRGSCGEPWCAFHEGDPGATNLSAILRAVRDSSTLHAVWLDVKHTRRTTADYDDLTQTVVSNLGAGPTSVRKFWGVWPASQVNSPYVTNLVDKFLGRSFGGGSQNVFIIEVDREADARRATDFCSRWGIQCGLSAGSPFAGNGFHLEPSTNPLNDKLLMLLLNERLTHPNINSLFSWTFNWRGPNEDDMVRLMFRDRSYWERMMGSKRLCALEGNGLIVGPMNNLYSENFCSNSDARDICTVTRTEIIAGPNVLGNRASNIGAARNGYSTSGRRC